MQSKKTTPIYLGEKSKAALKKCWEANRKYQEVLKRAEEMFREDIPMKKSTKP